MSWEGWAAVLALPISVVIAWIGARYGLAGQRTTAKVQETAELAKARNDNDRILLDYSRRLENRVNSLETYVYRTIPDWWDTDHDPWDDQVTKELERASPGATDRLKVRTPLPRPQFIPAPVQAPQL